MSERRRPGEAKPFQRKDGRWQLDVQVGHGSRGHRVRRSLYGSSRDEVLGKRDDFLRRTKLGLGPIDERLTVAAYLIAWEDGLTGLRPRTVESYRHTVDHHLIPHLGTISLVQLRAIDIRRAVRAITAATGIRTAGYAVTILRIALGVAVRDRILERNEASDVARPTTDEPEREVLNVAAIRKLVDAVAGDRLEALYVLACSTGLRRGELLGLRWRDVDEATATLRVNVQLMYRPGDAYELKAPKTKRSRRPVGLSAVAMTALAAHRSRQRLERLAAGPAWRPSDLVFTTAKGGPLAGSTVVHALHRHLERAGLPRQRFHDLRHAALSALAAAGLSQPEIMAIAGHTDPTTTARYTHAAPASRLGAVAMDRLLAPVAVAVAVNGNRPDGDRA